ncbi:hypothetical protein J116_000140 [Streptomyces thermolilacinus SPC6]|uniref:Uncharacterized protein n=1 Tax=Streptomyces thermolilacinus SPC6 TaxID=1306406 RepID=A0A1D3DLD7_9ACTN|nr:hypothetical protein J116_000140 [Streptomyces thermolilacinus SPC6]
MARCSEGKICLFYGHNLTGDVLLLDPVDVANVGWAWKDRASSVWNRSDRFACIWTDADYYGHWFTIPPGAKQELLFAYDNAVTALGFGAFARHHPLAESRHPPALRGRVAGCRRVWRPA